MGLDLALPAPPWEEITSDPLDTVDNIAGVSGAWALSSGVLRGTGAAYIVARHAQEVHRPAVFLEVDVRLPAAATGEAYGGVVGRWNGTETTAGSWLAAQLARTSTTAGNPFTAMRVHRSNAGFSFTVNLPVAIPVDTWARVGALIDGTTIVGFVNGEPIATGTATPGEKLSHRVGLAGGAGSLGPEFRNLRIAAPPLPTFRSA